jgi:hypothetical protein
VVEAQGKKDVAVRHYEQFLEADPRSAAASGVRQRVKGLRAGPVTAATRR